MLCVRLHLGVALALLLLLLLGQCPLVSAGWSVWPPSVYVSPWRTSRCAETPARPRRWPLVWHYARHTWRIPLWRSLALTFMMLCTQSQLACEGLVWAVLLPWAAWLGQGMSWLWPRLDGQPEWRLLRCLLRLAWCGLLGVHLGLLLSELWGSVRVMDLAEMPLWGPNLDGVGLCLVTSAHPRVVVAHDRQQGRYLAELEGSFTLAVPDGEPLLLRLFILFLRLLDDPGKQRGGRRTREGRAPCVAQQYLAKVLSITQPEISRWEDYWRERDWRRLLSQKSAEVLTLEVQQRIIETWAHWPRWSAEAVHRLLNTEGVPVTLSQVQQAAEESGWQVVRQVLGGLCVQAGEQLRLREGWLVGELLELVGTLLEKVEGGQGLTAEERLNLNGWRATAESAGLQVRAPREAEPWLRHVEQILFRPSASSAQREGETRPRVCCPQCGSTHVGRKGREGRPKKVIDGRGQVQEVAVERYRCHNRACARESFSVYPPGVVPYSHQRLEVHVLALQMYAWGYSTYRRTGQALGVASMTAYRWVSAFGQQLLPVAALFGLVRSSAVVGVDEKWVQVPKNHKAAGEHRHWMYVYLAVDVYTYDLLHIAIYAHNTRESAQTFLLALRAKGYHPEVLITDLRHDYGPVISQVFPQAEHHECLFHAAQALHRQLAERYGWEATRHDRGVIALRQAFDEPLQARTRCAAQHRYEQLMAQRECWVAEKPELAAVFGLLEAHWPKLVNGIGSDLIPRTNNTVELVIRRFDQHYQNFCGFESLETAARYLGVFEKVYRFTAFSDDAQPRIRGKSPLQLAGYDVAAMPMHAACNAGLIIQPARSSSEGVPNA